MGVFSLSRPAFGHLFTKMIQKIVDPHRSSGAQVLLTRLLIFGGLTAALSGAVIVATQHNDISRTGVNSLETVLKTSNVNVSTFGKLFSRTVDGQIYAQPVYVSGVAVPSQGTHNIVFICTEHNSVYAFDADVPAASSPLWHVNFGKPVPSTVISVTRNLVPEIGITSTPVIDPSTNILYVVAETYENSKAVFRLHALDLATGAEHFSNPVIIQGTVPGTGLASVGGALAFDPLMHWQRSGLLLSKGNIFIAFGSHQDTPPFHGWIFAYGASNLQQTGLLCLSPNGDSAGVWQAGAGLVADTNGYLYVQTGDGTMDANTGMPDYGDSIVKISATSGLKIVDYFSPSNQGSLSASDIDFGAGGPVLLPGTSLLLGGGKDGKIFVLSTNNLGQFHATDQVVQSWQATFSLLTSSAGGLYGGNVYYNARLYIWGRRDSLKVFSFNGSQFNPTPVSQSTFAIVDGKSNEPAMSLSANATTPGTGILWATYSINGLASDGMAYPGIMRAFDASDVSKELWNSEQNPGRDAAGSWAKWVPPTVANGKVYLATWDNKLNVYGLLASGSGGTLSGTGNSNTAATNITAEGSADWVHWGDSSLNRKAGVTAQIGNYSIAGSGTASAYGNDPRPLAWTGGTPTASSSNNTNGVFITGLQNGFVITAPADTTPRTLSVHVGGLNSGGTLTAHLSDGSAPDFVDTTNSTSGQYDRNYTLTYSAGTSAQSVTVTWKMTSGTGNVTLSAAALTAGSLGNTTIAATSGTPQAATVNTAFGATFQALVKDSGNNPVSGVTVTFTAPAGGASGTFSGSTTATALTAANGVATAPSFTANGRAGSYAVTAIAPGTASAASFSLTNNPGPAAVISASGGTPQSAVVNSLFATALQATVKDASNNPVSGITVTFNAPASGASGTFDGAPTAVAVTTSTGVATAPAFTADGQAGSYTVTAAASGLPASASFSLTNSPAGSTSGNLSGSISTPSGTRSLTTEGTLDWAHWGLSSGASYDHKATAPQISNALAVASAAQYTNNSVGFSWTDGSPTVSATGTTTGVYREGVGQGFQLTAPADLISRTLRVYVGAWRAQARMIAHLSDGSAPDYSDSTLTNNAGKTTLQEYTFTYNAASPGQTLTITFTEASQTTSTDSGNVALQSATLAGGVVAPDFTVSATPSSRSVTAGGSTTYTVGVTALNGFAGSVGFSVSGMPSGVTAAFSPAAATGSGSSTMTLTTATGTAAGTYPLYGQGNQREPGPYGQCESYGDRRRGLFAGRNAVEPIGGGRHQRQLHHERDGAEWICR